MIFFVSGATGGHLYPAIAIANQLKKPAFFIVSRQHPVEKILAPYKFGFKVIKLNIKALIAWPILLGRISLIMIKKKPKLLITMGGGICIPCAIIGWAFGIPVLSFEQNAIPGRATKGTQFFAKKIITAFESAKKGLLLKSKVQCLGNPIRLDYPDNDQFPKEWMSLKGKTLAIIGGSQGALKINQFIEKNKKKLLNEGFNIIHLTGDQHFKGNETSLSESLNGKYYIALRYVTNMNAIYEKATVVMCRAGATTLAELKYYQIPSILIPYPFAMDNHQEKNAVAFIEENAHSVKINESDLNLDIILSMLTNHSENKKQPSKASENKKLNTICELIESYLE